MSDSEPKDWFAAKPTVAATPTPAVSEPAPAIPQRAPSHSKKAHVALSRERSFKRSMSPPPLEISQPTLTTQTSFYDQATAGPMTKSIDSHPFINELAKVNEVAEGFGSTGMVLDEEEQEMLNKGLQKFSVRDYIHEISGGIYEDQLGLNPWI